MCQIELIPVCVGPTTATEGRKKTLAVEHTGDVVCQIPARHTEAKLHLANLK